MRTIELIKRPRRLRQNQSLLNMFQETSLSANDFIYPLFVDETIDTPVPIASMPGISRLPLTHVESAVSEAAELGLPAVILFGIPASKDAVGSSGWDPEGIVQLAIRAAKNAAPDLCVLADACFCEYTDHGHCGVLSGQDVDNDKTLANLQKLTLSYAEAGVDIIAPSGMMDGMVAAIRAKLDGEGFQHIPVMSYAVKYASAYFGPFRDAVDSAPGFGDRSSYQMNPANRREALREALLDVEEGADILMVKPALAYMDIIRDVKAATCLPLAAYNVSGEYAMIKAAAQQGWIDEKRLVLETMTSLKRAGADLIISYHAMDVAQWLADD
ncbi:MAG: porphobilinogen synthase [Mariprofundaceae bacterium]